MKISSGNTQPLTLSAHEELSSVPSSRFFNTEKVNTLGYIILAVLAVALLASVVAMVLTKDITFTIVQSILGVMLASIVAMMKTPLPGNSAQRRFYQITKNS
ncbi:hypothetical protein [Chlamydiifrater volucris]|uniref:hypothetical protein n=1 Tax=Chlamydiifrater volucris TaxID=2681470 RepID=UPI001BCEF0A7|nr:hypothetical protein [Chlamydiifrater volucris]